MNKLLMIFAKKITNKFKFNKNNKEKKIKISRLLRIIKILKIKYKNLNKKMIIYKMKKKIYNNNQIKPL